MEINTTFEIITIAFQLTEEKAPTSILFQIYQKNVFDLSNSFVASYLAIQEGPNQRKQMKNTLNGSGENEQRKTKTMESK